jgi:hypothetical protein
MDKTCYTKLPIHILLFILCVSFSCSRPQAQTLLINEIMITSKVPADSGTSWIEIKNRSTRRIERAEYNLSINGKLYPFPQVPLKAGDYGLINLSNRALTEDFTIQWPVSDTIRFIGIISALTGKAEDLVQIPFMDSVFSFGRYPDGGKELLFYPPDKISPGRPNPDFGPWQKISNHLAFERRDSSPNACLFFRNRFWIFGGWREENRRWYSRSDVWSSSDGREWELVNDHPPYDPYSSIIQFKNRIWAFSTVAYRSGDGIKWEKVADIPLSIEGRICKFKNRLYWAKKDSLFTSRDGIKWQKVSYQVPWKPRQWPGLVVFRNKLWVIGGGIGYGSNHPEFPNDVWSSSNGKTWTLVQDSAAWPGRYWFGTSNFDRKLWIMGGWNYYHADDANFGNRNDVWVSDDGSAWQPVTTPTIWPERHAFFLWTTKKYIFISSGYGGGGRSRLYNDLWRMEK